MRADAARALARAGFALETRAAARLDAALDAAADPDALLAALLARLYADPPALGIVTADALDGLCD